MIQSDLDQCSINSIQVNVLTELISVEIYNAKANLHVYFCFLVASFLYLQ